MEKKLWHSMPLTSVIAALKTTEQGLSTEETSKRLNEYGPNALPEEKPLASLKVLLNQFKSPLVYVLFGAAIISFLLQDLVDTAIILVAVFINASLGFYQEYKANRAITFLRKLIDLKARVVRNGNEMLISSRQLVPGDIIILDPGDKVPADARLIKIDNFQVIEAALTGESVPSEKRLGVVDRGEVLADRENMVYSGTVVASGRAKAVVCATGLDTELGSITQLVQETKEEQTPLQKQLATFSKNLTYIVIALAFAIILIGKWQGRAIFGFGQAARESMLNTAAAIAVAAIPEGLLIAVTAILAIGMQSILRRKALVRRLVAAETLGSVSVICTDKTGTLTEGKMQVSKIITSSQEVSVKESLHYQGTATLKDHDLIVKISLLCNNAQVENPQDELHRWQIIGDPTESALLSGAMQAGVPHHEIQKQQPRLAEIPFDSAWKYMATLHKLDRKKDVIYVKGAPEVLLKMSSRIRIEGKKVTLTKARRAELKKKYEHLGSQGLRLLAFGYKQLPANKEVADLHDELEELIFVGFIALKDPLREETKSTFELTCQAGIRPIIVTGDHKFTAQAIVAELGIPVKEKNIIEGGELDQMSDEELDERIVGTTIFARVEPKHKLRIIHAWQKRGETVAMTGDGVNDAPALKVADVGIALGSGTDVAKETADIILLDNNFKTIVAAVERGRVIFENIKKVVLYLLADSFSEIILIVGALLLKLPLPVLPAQIIWINLITDGFPSFALTVEPGEHEVMKDKPRKKNSKILDGQMKFLIFVIGVFTDMVLLTVFAALMFFSGWDIEHIRTLIFAALAVDSLFYVFACRSFRHTIFGKNLFSNKLLLLGVLLGFALQLLAVYEPHLQYVFDTVPLAPHEWLIVISLGIIKLGGIELTKYLFIIKKVTRRALSASA